MDQPLDLTKVRSILKLARALINQQDPNLALEHLRRIHLEIEQYAGTPEWAEFSLLQGEACCAKSDEAAGTFLAEANDRIQRLGDPDRELLFRLAEHRGDFANRVLRRPSVAKEYYLQAKAYAVAMRVHEFTARVELKIILIDLRTDRDPQEENFRTLRRAGKAGKFTCEQQLAAWHLHLGESSSLVGSLRYARHHFGASEDHFRTLLDSTKLERD
ncbi:MAG: hypothetical protein ACRD3T_05840 [Terriglobia bacterium]